MLMMPADTICELQLGFRMKRSTSFACSFLNDVIQYFKNQNTPLHICSLDAEKCFDRTWHDSLFYKLYKNIPVVYWRLLLKWYKLSKAVVRWDGKFSSTFDISRGTKQGSVLSPVLFNIFIDDLLIQLKNSKVGIRIGPGIYIALAYADNVTSICSTVPRLQKLINICEGYAVK